MKASRLADLAERRNSPRRRVEKAGFVLHDGARLGCKIVDQSAGGACIVVPADWIPPPTFILFVIDERLVARVRFVWRTGQRVGIAVSNQWFKPEQYPDRSIVRQLL